MRQIALLATLLATGAAATSAGAESITEIIVDQATSPAKTGDDKGLSADMAATLRKAGFSDLRVMPNSILVRAKDKAGRPVAMVLNPGSMTEVVTLDPHSGSAAAGNGSKTLTGSSTFATVLPTARLGSTLIGLKVRNTGGEDIGKIKDLAVDHDGISAYIVAVGGLLGIGDHYVAVAPEAIEIAYDQASNTYHAKMNATTGQLKAAPAFTYDGSFKAGRP